MLLLVAMEAYKFAMLDFPSIGREFLITAMLVRKNILIKITVTTINTFSS